MPICFRSFTGAAPTRYEEEVDRSHATGDATTFIEFSIAGYVSHLRREMESLRVVWPQQRSHVEWVNYVQTAYPARQGVVARRQIALALSMPDAPASMLELRQSTAALYGGHADSQRLLHSDLAALRRRGLARNVAGNWQPCRNLLDG
jgi:hypothetical protein